MRVVRKGLIGVTSVLVLWCAIRARSLQTVALQKLLSLDFARPIVNVDGYRLESVD